MSGYFKFVTMYKDNILGYGYLKQCPENTPLEWVDNVKRTIGATDNVQIRWDIPYPKTITPEAEAYLEKNPILLVATEDIGEVEP